MAKTKKRPFPADEVLDDATITGTYVRRHLPMIPEEDADDFAVRLTNFFGRGLFERAQARADAKRAEYLKRFYARRDELMATGMSGGEGLKILAAEGWPCLR